MGLAPRRPCECEEDMSASVSPVVLVGDLFAHLVGLVLGREWLSNLVPAFVLVVWCVFCCCFVGSALLSWFFGLLWICFAGLGWLFF